MQNHLTFRRLTRISYRVTAIGALSVLICGGLSLAGGKLVNAQSAEYPVAHETPLHQTYAPPVAPVPVINRTREYNVKGVYLYNFARFVTWPREAQSDIFTIGVLGESDILAPLKKVQSKRKITDRHRKIKLSIELLQFAEDEPVSPCHILFVSRDVPSENVEDVIQQLEGSNTLIVGESTDFISAGGTVGFRLIEDGIGFDLNLAEAKEKGLTFNAQLLKAAHKIVNSPSPPSTSALSNPTDDRNQR